jgi:maleylacetoacetate isomerase
VKLYTFWRSLATYRVRVAMNIKGLTTETVDIDLIKGDQHEAAFKAVNPARAVPALVLDDGGPALFQSTAIMEYLEEVHPHPAILPSESRARARVRALSQIVISDSHPLSVPRIRKYLTESASFDQPKLNAWISHWQNEALRSLEGHLARDRETGTYCHGETITMADICVASQGVAAGMFKLDMTPYPTVARIVKTCFAQEAFAREHPLKQSGAPAGGHH